MSVRSCCPLIENLIVMDASFWHQRWEKNEIAFHQTKANPLLVEYFHQLSLAKGNRIFVPLCGKTLDISWLLSNGYCVAGAELSQIAIEQLFMELGVQPAISGVGEVDQWSAKDIDIRSEEHTSELQSHVNLVCRLLLE